MSCGVIRSCTDYTKNVDKFEAAYKELLSLLKKHIKKSKYSINKSEVFV